MSYAMKKDRTRRFLLALRMGVPIFLLLITTVVLFTLPAALNDLVFKATFLSVSIITIVYYIFYLINQSDSSSIIDPLTKTFNRESIHGELRQYQKKQLLNSISLIQIKNVYEINNHYGYERGDYILQRFADTLDSFLQSRGDRPLIGRFQGADFIIGSTLTPEQMQKLLTEFQHKTTSLCELDIELHSAVSLSIDDIAKTIEHLYDTVHQKASKDTRRSVSIQDIKNLSAFEQEIIDAAKRKDFDFRFKPIKTIQNGEVALYEAIIKLRTDSFGKLPAKKYIPVINRLDMEQTFDLGITDALAKIMRQKEGFALSFNISPFSLRNEEFANELFETIERRGAAAERFVIELYENKVYHDIAKYKKTLTRLKGFGLRLCLDNFGAMNASLEYIKQLPIDIVQFDKEFSSHLKDPSYRTTLKAFVKMCKEMEVETVLKWIDKPWQAEEARELDVDHIQGFIIGKLYSQNDLLKE